MGEGDTGGLKRDHYVTSARQVVYIKLLRVIQRYIEPGRGLGRMPQGTLQNCETLFTKNVVKWICDPFYKEFYDYRTPMDFIISVYQKTSITVSDLLTYQIKHCSDTQLVINVTHATVDKIVQIVASYSSIYYLQSYFI